ncbi:MAG TPA: prolyl oligopeptidase family serine peptidase [Ideonella sp.]|uniref:prolyl oligopeptidase family serine peptidase n=1 Tax=Ideonella sp. TaxID=1929293 RepID=UPI002C343A3A|nr:prolyl oligopeptidase family serine peptidase [Ideonella sp.]HSI49228.1 prolyl oligopeptidase family serine peptidase [Ideonella sp.]
MIQSRTLAGAVRLAWSLSLPLAATNVHAALDEAPPAPVAKVRAVTDTYFGETVLDRYRWMEDDQDPDWLPFLRGQNTHTRGVLSELPGRAALLARIQQVSGDSVATGQVHRNGGKLFYLQRPAGANNFSLFVRDGKGQPRVLVDPTQLDRAGHHTSLDWWEASPDGRHVAYGLSQDGSEDSTLHVLDLATGRDLPERITDTQNASPSWLPDGSGFFYNQLTGKVDTPERFLDSRARFHRLGTNPANDPVLVARGRAGSPVFERIQSPTLLNSAHGPYVLLMLADVRPEVALFIATRQELLAGKPRWQPVAGFEDEVTGFNLQGDKLYLLANHGHPRGRVLQTSARAPDLATAREVVAESSLVLQQMARAKDGLYLKGMDGGLGRLQRLGADGKLTQVALPFDGTLGGLSANADEDGLLCGLSGWLEPAGVWAVSARGLVTDTGLTPRPAIDTSAYTSERRFATAKDGTRIPYDVVYKKGLPRDGSAPTFLQAYGSYGIPGYTPSFVGRALALMDQGAVMGYAHVRGGGEYGRDWHRAGQLENKPNTWRDLIAISEDLVAQRYTSPQHLAIGGRSAGGIAMGMALTERPDLFAAVVSGVGWHNPLRYVAEQNGYGEEPEWGSLADPAGYRALKGIDSYQAVKDGVRYPAVLLTTGVTDPRVAPFHPAKMAARLQAASTSGKPVLLRVDFDAGHGMGSTRAQQDAEAADTDAFILWQTGAAAHQPKP